VQVSETLLITVSDDDARDAGTNPGALADSWATKLSAAVAAHYAGSGYGPKPGDWAPEEAYRDKWVPILSILSGTRIGAARANGPVSRVDLVQGIGQLELNMKVLGSPIEINLLVPISTKVPGRTIDRVKGVGITGLADYKL